MKRFGTLSVFGIGKLVSKRKPKRISFGTLSVFGIGKLIGVEVYKFDVSVLSQFSV